MSLATPIFGGFELENPFWVASSHYSHNKQAIDQWRDLSPSALTLKTTAESQRLRDTSFGRSRFSVPLEPLHDPILGETHGGPFVDFFSDGPKTLELLSLVETESLLTHAKKVLPNTKIGVSILMGEDYQESARILGGADFAELNFKYSGRLVPKERSESYFQIHATKFEHAVKEVASFCDAFRDTPIFMKLSRELPWLTPSSEFASFLGVLERAGNRRGIGLIIANTRQIRIPASWIPEGLREIHKEGELASGVLAGHQLFLETYNLIRNIVSEYNVGDRFPVIATGGVLNLSCLLEAVWAGACAVQLCSAFDSYGLPYYDWLATNLRDLVAESGCGSYKQFVRYLRTEGSYVLTKVRHWAARVPYSKDAALVGRLKQNYAELLGAVLKRAQEEVEVTISGAAFVDLVERIGTKVISADDLRIPAFDMGAAPGVANTGVVDGVQLMSARGNFSAQMIAEGLSAMGYQLSRFTRTDEIVRRITEGDPWDLAFIPASHLDEVCLGGCASGVQPVVLGVATHATYYLYGLAWGASELREVYHFPGKESEACLQAWQRRQSEHARAALRPTKTSHLVFLTLYPKPHIGFFAKEPLASIYALLAEGARMQPIGKETLPVCIIGSMSFCQRESGRLVLAFYHHLATARAQVLAPATGTGPVDRLVREIVRLYLPSPLWLD